MGRHAQSGALAPPHPDTTLARSLPGWGLFTTALATVCVRWTTPDRLSALAVTLLGLLTTAALWWAVLHSEQLRQAGRGRPVAAKVTMLSRSAPGDGDVRAADTGARRVTP